MGSKGSPLYDMGTRRNLRRGGGKPKQASHKDKKAPHMEKKVSH